MRLTTLIASLALWLGITISYWLRPDCCAAVTIWPVWGWVLPGVALALLGRRQSKRLLRIAIMLWVLSLVLLAEEPRALLRFRRWPARQWEDAHRRGRALRVISLNCAGGSEEAAAEVAPYHPDVVLLQESPSRDKVEALAHALFGHEGGAVWGVDASILARGPLTAIPVARDQRSFITQARLRTPSGQTVEVISTRLLPPLFRTDLYSPACWRDQMGNRRQRREQVRQIAARVARIPSGQPIIVGGDMNAPQGDAALWPLRPRLRDTFPEAGLGWGNTAINEALVIRIDQIWVSDDVVPTGVVARRAANSDHRMVIAEVLLEGR